VLDRPFAVIKAEESPTKENVSFARVGRAVIKVSVKLKCYDLTFNAARGGFTGALPQPLISIEPAAESDLLDLQRWLTQNGTGADQVAIREFLRIVRDEPAQPVPITIVNAEQVGATPKVLTVKRDDSGKLSGAVSQPIN
jgi:hypothetical protein